MRKRLKTSTIYLVTIISALFLFMSDELFGLVQLLPNIKIELNVCLNKVLLSVILFAVIFIISTIVAKVKNNVKIHGRNYVIEVKYGNIFYENDCKKVIPFDECFTSVRARLKQPFRAQLN